ncbi:hypothetical protein JOD45_003006 [Scopulibacillus daqui]|uniref:DUF1259 domain-containing protein n=1 Tax=Scopulibacillus daqui TaxID=1469162 RepID=A0ABS2Q3A1_9BACL|nr:DUF1259 domain-containing protein [Scopulibacillus daqui]MBM7646772.1 hypothetical protein [Scopulibacillus daqui]
MPHCKKAARILGGKVKSCSRTRCEVTKERHLHATILGRDYETDQEFVFESIDQKGRTLNTVEFTVLQQEVNPLIDALRKYGFKVTAVHNHWLFDQPRLMYVHAENVENPYVAAEMLSKVLTVLEN